MTTVGYGDMSPVSDIGKLFGGLCAVSGILLIAMPVGLLSTNFNKYYEDEMLKTSLAERLKKNKAKQSNQKTGQKIHPIKAF